MIEIRQFTHTQLKLYNSNNKRIGFINNAIEALRVQIDIAEKELSGYYFKYGNIKMNILPNGDVENWPIDMYNEKVKYILKLKKIQNKIK